MLDTNLDEFLNLELNQEDTINSECQKEIARILFAFCYTDITTDEVLAQGLEGCDLISVTDSSEYIVSICIPSRCRATRWSTIVNTMNRCDCTRTFIFTCSNILDFRNKCSSIISITNSLKSLTPWPPPKHRSRRMQATL